MLFSDLVEMSQPKYPSIVINLNDAGPDPSERIEYVARKLRTELGPVEAGNFRGQATGKSPTEIIDVMLQWVTVE